MDDDTAETGPSDNKGHIPTPEEATEGYKPLEAEIETKEYGMYPPDVDPTIDIGGSPEEKGALDEEYRH